VEPVKGSLKGGAGESKRGMGRRGHSGIAITEFTELSGQTQQARAFRCPAGAGSPSS
jgi:hypothetical protein